MSFTSGFVDDVVGYVRTMSSTLRHVTCISKRRQRSPETSASKPAVFHSICTHRGLRTAAKTAIYDYSVVDLLL